MRTKSILLGAAVLAAGIASSMAQNVYSVNVVGYVNVPLNGDAVHNGGTGLYTLISNPLDASNGGANPGGNTLTNLFPAPGLFDEFLQWNGVNGFNIATFGFAGWDHNFTVAPGTGGFYQTTSQQTNTFAGTVLQGSLTNHFAGGFQVIGNQVPVVSTIDTNGLTAAVGLFDEVLLWNETKNSGNGGFDIYTLGFSGWTPSTPTIVPGQAVFLDTASSGNWVQTFTVQ